MEREPETQKQAKETDSEKRTVNKPSRVVESDATEELPASAGANELTSREAQNENQMLPADQQRKLRRHQPEAEEQVVSQTDNGRKGAPSVRLDMDLDVDVQLKAKIQGDITLSILDGNQQ